MTEWAAAGFSIEKFWSLTPKETSLLFDAARLREEREERTRRWHTWHTVALAKAKTFPKLGEFAKPAKENPSPTTHRKQSAEAQIAALQSVFAARRRG